MRDIAGRSIDCDASVEYIILRFAQRLRATCSYGYVCPPRRQAKRNRAPDPAASAEDDAGTTFLFHIHG